MRSILFLSGASVALASSAQKPLSSAPDDPFTASMDDYVADAMTKWHFPGLAIGVIDGSNTYFKVRKLSCNCLSTP